MASIFRLRRFPLSSEGLFLFVLILFCLPLSGDETEIKKIDGKAIVAYCRTAIGYPYDRGKVLFGRAPDGHPSNSWDYAVEGWHIKWGWDRKDNDGDGEVDEADEHFLVCSDLLVMALRSHGVELYSLMAADYIKRHRLKSIGGIQSALKKLSRFDLIKQNKEGIWMVVDPIFGRWLK